MLEPLLYKGDSGDKARARAKQSSFRESMGCGFDPNHRLGKYGAFLLPDDARDGKNFYEGFRQEILDAIKERYPANVKHRLYNPQGLFSNMLRSEHIPWNIFIPMRLSPSSLERAAKVMNVLLGEGTIDRITDIRIEWAPPYEKCLNDGTSFDTYIEYEKNGERCGVGVEVKYTEVGYPLTNPHEVEQLEDRESPYARITESCGFFVPDVSKAPLMETKLVKNDYRQIWRNHILGASMLLNEDRSIRISHFHSITLYPSGNKHFRKVLPEYERLLTPYGRSTFMGVTFERLFELLGKYYQEPEYKDWIAYLNKRYSF